MNVYRVHIRPFTNIQSRHVHMRHLDGCKVHVRRAYLRHIHVARTCHKRVRHMHVRQIQVLHVQCVTYPTSQMDYRKLTADESNEYKMPADKIEETYFTNELETNDRFLPHREFEQK
ncbi:hypothetical protein LOAG_08404 [Loa loa]|uniref:Uncharacterized protein n=1 Tax=Loa loa TaxID=7209 RepID=A0A1S0TUJ9_LOALO|nr:hypothetical protein LOAG_08404 [Loa loa]EFO20086.1 hypothetical protein LOAG_08404 [Loa loa]